MSFHTGADIKALVGDIGSFSTKIGFCGEGCPQAVFRTACGVVRKDSDGEDMDVESATSAPKEVYCGDGLATETRDMEIEYPVECGEVKDWDLWQSLWQAGFKRLTADPKEHPVLLVEPALIAPAQRRKFLDVMFESFAVPKLFIAQDLVLSCYAQGKTSGLVIDVGGGTAVTAPVQDGFLLRGGVESSRVAGNLLTRELKSLVEKVGFDCPPQIAWKKRYKPTASYARHWQLDTAMHMKHSVCRTFDTFLDFDSPVGLATTIFELPDKRLVELGVERFRVPELMFNPSPLAEPHVPLPQMAINSLFTCPVELQKAIVQDIVMAGGGALFPGTNERLTRSIQSLLPPGAKSPRILPSAGLDRQYAAWIGGSILGSLGSFPEIWITKAEYEEHGSSIVDRKCP